MKFLHVKTIDHMIRLWLCSEYYMYMWSVIKEYNECLNFLKCIGAKDTLPLMPLKIFPSIPFFFSRSEAVLEGFIHEYV